MAFTKRLVESFMQTSGTATSGYQDDVDINRNLAMIDNELMETFAPLYSENGKVQDILSAFIEMKEDQTVTNGKLDKPTDYVQYVDSVYKGKPVYPRNVNEISLIETSPIRIPTLEKGPYFVAFYSDEINYKPKEINKVNLVYIRRPVPGEIKFTPVSTDDSDYNTITVQREIEWPERVFNLFYYHLLEKYGIEKKDELELEYSQLGIQRELVKNN